jgi:hypothetical protein
MMPAGSNAQLPALVFQQVGAPAPRDLQNQIGLVESRWQFDCYAPKYLDAISLASLLDDALVDNFSGLATVTVQQCIRDGGPTDLGTQDGDKLIRRISLDYVIYYEEI